MELGLGLGINKGGFVGKTIKSNVLLINGKVLTIKENQTKNKKEILTLQDYGN